MWHLFVLCAILIGVSCSTISETNGTYGENIGGSDLIKLGRKLNKPMLTLTGMAIQNLLPCSEWTQWSSCDATKLGYFGSQRRTRSCTNHDHSGEKTLTTEIDNKMCEGSFCPVSYNLTNDGFCIKLNTTAVSNDNAVKQCQQDGGYLIHIDSQRKLDDVKPLVQGLSTYPHIDGRRKSATSPWTYTYGSTIAFLKWQLDYPRNTSKTCLVLNWRSYQQYNYRCDGARPFLCEILKV